MQETYLPEHVKAVLSNVYPLLQAVSHLDAPFVEQPLVHCGSHTEVNKQFCIIQQFPKVWTNSHYLADLKCPETFRKKNTKIHTCDRICAHTA